MNPRSLTDGEWRWSNAPGAITIPDGEHIALWSLCARAEHLVKLVHPFFNYSF